MNAMPCGGEEVKGMVYAIHKASQSYGPGLRTAILFKGSTFSGWWTGDPGVQSPAQELRFNPERCVRCGNCLDDCITEASQALSDQEDEERIAIDREICIACGACISGCTGQARTLVGKCMSVGEVMEEIRADLALYRESGGGVTFSGGEPLIQFDFLAALLHGCRAAGIHTAVGTSGYCPWEFLERLCPVVDLFLYEIKLMDEDSHRRFTGLSNALILDNLRKISEAGKKIILQVSVIEGITTPVENIEAMVEFARSLPNLERIHLVPFHPVGKEAYDRLGKAYPFNAGMQPNDQRMNELLGMILKAGLHAAVVDTN